MRPIFIISVLLLRLGIVCGQTVSGDSLLFYEYAYFKTSDSVVRQQLLLEKINLYLAQKNTGPETFNEIKRVKPKLLLNETQRADFLWNAMAISYLNNESDYANFYLNEYESIKNDTSFAFNLLAILVNKYTDTSDVNKRINQLTGKDSLFKNLHCFMDLASYKRKHLNLYLISSLVVPGSGTAMNGYVLKGAVSLALTAASVYGVVKLVEYGLYLNAVLWGTGVGLKFYAGNIKLTEQSFHKAEDKKRQKIKDACELKVEQLLNKYPIILKTL